MANYDNIKNIINNEFNNELSFFNNDKFFGIYCKNENLHQLISFLKNNNKLKFNQLTEITAIDFPSRELRFDLVYLFLSFSLNLRIMLKISINENETVESITNLFKSANWYERECYDLFGIKFTNHPDLRRIMTDYNFEGHPLRKDFPLTGHTEVRYDDLEKKVLYEPVKLQQEFRNFDFASPWEGIPNELIGDDKAIEEDK